MRRDVMSLRFDNNTECVQVAALATCDTVTAFIQQLHHLLRNMKLDLANFHVHTARPHFQQVIRALHNMHRLTTLQHAAEYERAKFAQLLEGGQVTLEHTRTWLCRAIDVVHDNGAAVVEGVRLADYVHEMYVLVLAGGEGAMPETLQLDQTRVNTWRLRLRRAVVVATLHTLASTLAPRLKGCDDFTQVCMFASDVSLHICCIAQELRGKLNVVMAEQVVVDEATAALVVDTVQGALLAAGHARMAAEKVDMLVGSVMGVAEGRQPVMGILQRRAMVTSSTGCDAMC